VSAVNRSSQKVFCPGTTNAADRFAGMEYEMDDETRLFDDSTNPSLEHRAPWQPAPAKPRDVRPRRHEPQVAVVIPEEEHQLG
jgi:hypothetical protein